VSSDNIVGQQKLKIKSVNICHPSQIGLSFT